MKSISELSDSLIVELVFVFLVLIIADLGFATGGCRAFGEKEAASWWIGGARNGTMGDVANALDVSAQ